MASGHPQAYLSASEVIAASPSLDAASLSLPDPGGDALLVVEVDGVGRVAARRTGDFTHVIAGEKVSSMLWDAPFWRADGDQLEELSEIPAPDLARALEALADAVHPQRDPRVGRAKDLAAGAVLVAAIAAAVIGALILGPRLFARLPA